MPDRQASAIQAPGQVVHRLAELVRQQPSGSGPVYLRDGHPLDAREAVAQGRVELRQSLTGILGQAVQAL